MAPDHPRTRKCHFTIGKSIISSKNCLLSLSFICESGKIIENRAEMAREVRRGNPKVTRRLPQRYPKVHPRSGVRSPQGAPGAKHEASGGGFAVDPAFFWLSLVVTTTPQTEPQNPRDPRGGIEIQHPETEGMLLPRGHRAPGGRRVALGRPQEALQCH